MMAEFSDGRHVSRTAGVRLGACAAAIALAAAAAPGAPAQTLKRYVTPQGETIYSDRPVPGARLVGEIEPPPPRDPAAVEAARQLEKERAEQANRLVEERLKGQADQRTRIEQATAKLEQARRQLEAGRAPKPGERIGTAGGGTRFTDEYLARQQKNEQAVKQAEQELQKARGQ